MRFEIRTAARALSTLVVLFVLVMGASMDVAAQRGRDWGRSHNRGRHLGWERGRRAGQNRDDDDRRSRWRRMVRRQRRVERRDDRRQRRIERRSFTSGDRRFYGSNYSRQSSGRRSRY
ncbi:MAG TPA: hypothetical protein VF668_23845 [Pyrinomonadaceae bacterium]|jgi:hypothetical protein